MRNRLSGFLLLGVLLAAWELSARSGMVSSSNWPAFSLVLLAVGQGVVSGELPAMLATTLRRTATGFALGSGCAVLLGLALGYSRVLREILNAPIEMLRPMPLTAIIPPLVLFLGVEDALKIFIVAFASFFPVLVSTVDGVRASSRTLIQTANTFRLGECRTLRSVVIPSALPSIFAGLRTSLSIALVVTITAEMIAGASGLGYFIVQSQYAMLPAPMYAAVICLSMAGYLLNRLFVAVESRVIPWYAAGGSGASDSGTSS